MTPMERFDELRKIYKAMMPPSNNISRKRRRHISHAANPTQVAEMAIIERACGAKHDRDLIERMKLDVQACLKSAGARI
jgi:hypothetical protein